MEGKTLWNNAPTKYDFPESDENPELQVVKFQEQQQQKNNKQARHNTYFLQICNGALLETAN